MKKKKKDGKITARETRKLNKLTKQMDKFYNKKKKDPFGDK